MPTEAHMQQTYALAGLHIASEIPLPNTLRCHSPAAFEDTVVVRHAKVPDALPAGNAYTEGTYLKVQQDSDNLLIRIPSVGRFLMRGKNEILIEAEPKVSDNDISAYLLGTVFGALCHRKGVVPLHASAIDVEGGCVAFAGHSGAGKSTHAAALGERGYQVISDDVCFLRQGKDGSILVWPGIGRIRLWSDSLEALNVDKSSVEREVRRYDKFLVPVAPPEEPFAPRRLLRLYQLAVLPEGQTPSIVQLQGAKSIELIVPNVYRLNLAEYLGAKPAIFSLCTAIARQVPIYEFRRPKSFDALPTALDVLEHHLRDAG